MKVRATAWALKGQCAGGEAGRGRLSGGCGVGALKPNRESCSGGGASSSCPTGLIYMLSQPGADSWALSLSLSLPRDSLTRSGRLPPLSQRSPTSLRRERGCEGAPRLSPSGRPSCRLQVRSEPCSHLGNLGLRWGPRVEPPGKEGRGGGAGWGVGG